MKESIKPENCPNRIFISQVNARLKFMMDEEQDAGDYEFDSDLNPKVGRVAVGRLPLDVSALEYLEQSAQKGCALCDGLVGVYEDCLLTCGRTNKPFDFDS